MKEKNLSNVSEAFHELRKVITHFTPQKPRTHRSKEDKVEYLYEDTIGENWAQKSSM